MGIIGGEWGYRVLRKLSPGGAVSCCDGSGADDTTKLAVFGARFWKDIRDKRVIDFGCGYGAEAIEMVARGAANVVGVDIRDSVLDVARARAAERGVSDACTFATTATDMRAETIVSIDAFEHFDDPAAILDVMANMLRNDGCVWISFGPPWYHPAGGHLFSIFPWAHLLFTERCLIRWRSDFKSDGATRFSEVAGGLNQMTVRRFIRLVERSPLRFDSLECVPIRRVRWLSNRLTRELFTSIVRCRLVKRGNAAVMLQEELR